MKQSDEIRALIPAEMAERIPENKKEHVFGNVVRYIEREKGELYEEIGRADEMTEDLKKRVTETITGFISMLEEKHRG